MTLLHSEIYGEKQPMIIIHGYLGMGENWKSMGKRFSEHYQVHLVDLRNHGKSFHSDDFNYDLMVQDLANYVDHHQLENITVIGHSMGGKTAMKFATTHQENIDRLIVVDIAPKLYPPHHQTILEALNAIDFELVKSRKDVEYVLKNYLDNPVVIAFFIKSLYRKEDGTYSFRFNLKSLTKNNPEVGKVMLTDDISYSKPALFVRGEKSDYIQPEDHQLIKSFFNNVEIKSIPDTSHWLHVEKPDEFYRVASEFLL